MLIENRLQRPALIPCFGVVRLSPKAVSRHYFAMNNIQDFFLFCSGVEASVLEKCPTDRNKYAGIGATVLFTGVLAFFSSGYALYTVFDSYWISGAFGLVWGAMIFNLDRYIVMSMKSNGQWWRDFLVAFPRILLAVLLAVVISKPLELRIFEKEIRAEMVQMEQEVFKQQEDRVKLRYQSQIDALRGQAAAIKSDILAKTAHRDSLAKSAVQEADGTGGSRMKNLGPIYLAKKAQANQAQTELDAFLLENQPLVREKEQAAQALEQTAQTDITQLDRGRYDGFAARLDALSRLSDRSAAIFWASIFITLLFVAIETSPILVKLISYRSPYDYVLHQQEHVYAMENLEQTTLLSNLVQNKLKVNTEVGIHQTTATIAMEKAIIDQKLQETLGKLKGRAFEVG